MGCRRILAAIALRSLIECSLGGFVCGVPVVVTQDVGMAWEITDAGAGMLCERSVASLLQALRKSQDLDRLRKMAYQARVFALRYDQGLIIEQWLNFYQAARARKKC